MSSITAPTKESVERYLWALVRHEIAGSRTPRVDACKELGIPHRRGQHWRQTNVDLYYQIRGEASAEMRSRVAAESEDLMVAYAQAERDALALIQTRLSADAFENRELILASKNLAFNRTAANTTARQARGEHDVIRVEHSAADIIKSLAALMPNVLTAYVDGEASEIKSLNKS